jgi:hypothetical protein
LTLLAPTCERMAFYEAARAEHGFKREPMRMGRLLDWTKKIPHTWVGGVAPRSVLSSPVGLAMGAYQAPATLWPLGVVQ